MLQNMHPVEDQSEQTVHMPGEAELLQETDDKSTRKSHVP